MKRKEEKFILDACCGGKFMWFNKKHPNTVYIDQRKEDKGYVDGRFNFCIDPDFIMDFRKLPKEWSNKFKLIVWDPPHLLGKAYNCRTLKKYGFLVAETWQDDFKKGFNELWRCLEDYGVLIFKFNDYDIGFKKVLALFPIDPLFGNTVSKTKKSSTKWFCFMKIPKELIENEK